MRRDRILKGLTAAALMIGTIIAFPTILQARDFKIIGNMVQIQLIKNSLSACPSLEKSLRALAKSKKFEGFRVTTSEEVGKIGPYSAAIANNEIIFTDDWLTQQGRPFSDIRFVDGVPPDNLCFALGHLAYHVANPFPLPRKEDIPDDGDVTELLTKHLAERLKAEAIAFLRAWPYVLEAARSKSHGASYDLQQLINLMFNLRYRFVFIGAIRPHSQSNFQILSNGDIPETEDNIAAIVAILKTSTMPDIQ